MTRSLFAVLIAFLIVPLFAAAQESPIPERRSIVSENRDYYGGDIRSIFDTTLDLCEQAALSDRNINAYTFNDNKGACFLKRDIESEVFFEGAVSAKLVNVRPEIVRRGAIQAGRLDFLPEGFLPEATRQARLFGRDYPVNGRTVDELVREVSLAEKRGDVNGAYWAQAALLNITDDPQDWLKLGRLAVKYKTDNKDTLRWIATNAAINAFLRTDDPAVESAALVLLAQMLEARGYGQVAIPTLRLAQEIAPDDRIAAALDRVVGLFGFRVLEDQIDADAAAPRYCVYLSEELQQNGLDYAPYVRVDGAGSLPVEVDGAQLCVEGLQHGQRYRMTLRAGLPAASGEKLAAPVELQFYVRDRSPSVRFVGQNYVLPKSVDAAIPLVVVNTDLVELKIFRVGDRNLLRVIQEGLFGTQLEDYYERTLRNQLGEQVWEGVGDVASTLNEDTTTVLPVGDALTQMEPGVYAMTARVPGEGEDWDPAATQWFIVTDLGIETLTGNDGLHVFLRGLSDAGARAGVTVTLIDAKNDVLGTAETDADGYVRFAPGLVRGQGSAAPAMLTAQLGDDFAFIDLGRPALDLSDRGVTGRASPPPIDVFLTTERGAYRPGETVYATILTRDAQAAAIADMPVTVVVTRPDGVEHTRVVVPDMGAGGRMYALPLSSNAQRGAWRLKVYGDPDSPALATQAFLVEDFLPERIDFDLTLPEGPITLDNVPDLRIDASYLYGAPAAGLDIEVDTVLRAVAGLPDYPGYRFGLQDEWFEPWYDSLGGAYTTDENGVAVVPLPLGPAEPTTRVLEVQTTVRLLDTGGRPVERSITRPIMPDTPRIGVKPLFDGVVDEGGSARFEVIAADASGRIAMPEIGWTLSKVETHYQWYDLDGYWDYEPVTRRIRVASGDVAAGTDMTALIEGSVDWGRYELKLFDKGGSGAVSSVAFYAGWYGAGAGSDTPDLLEVGLDKGRYAVGDVAELRLNARYAGKVLVRVESDRLISMQAIDVAAGESVVSLPVGEDWGAGAYVVATLIRPMDVEAKRNPARAIGLSYAPVDPGDRVLSAQFTTPDEMEPRGVFTASLQVDGIKAGQTVYATIAAVDVGILNLTGFAAPTAADYYFGQRRLGMEIRDVYGQLIDGLSGARGALRSGGDAGMARRNAPPPTEKLVAFFAGPLQADENGVISADFNMPAFNGTVRLMAVVWSGESVGQANKDVLVRDPVVVTATPPRFLAPGDRTSVQIELAHAFGPSGKMELEVSGSGALVLPEGRVRRTVTLGDKGRARISVPVLASDTGSGSLTVTLTTPDGRRLSKTQVVPVRINDPEVARTTRLTLPPDGTITLDASVLADMVAGTGSATLAVGPIARFDVPGLLQALDRYPYGCTEQLTSRAMPLLYFAEVSDAMGLSVSDSVDERIATAITGILANQSSRGSFGLWRPDEGDLWLDAYASDFLSRARAAGYDMPEQAFRAALDNLRNQVNYARDFENAGEGLAYALMVLAREKYASVGDLRYYADEKATDFATPMAMAQIGAALAYYGDQQRADRMFALAAASVRDPQSDDDGWRDDYGSYLRDTAAVLALAAEAGSDAVNVDRLARAVTRNQSGYRSTQEQVWTLLAAKALITQDNGGAVTINGTPAGGPVVRGISGDDDTATVIRNTGTRDVEAVLTTLGVPRFAEPAGGNGYRITRRYFTLEGEEISPDAILQNDRLVVVLQVTPERRIDARLMVNDPLPAGLEIDNPNLLRAGDVSALDWLKLDNVAVNTEFREDRFLAAVDWGGQGSFTLGYIVRAVFAGTFRQPAASVEDMYRPTYRAHTDTGTVTILPAR